MFLSADQIEHNLVWLLTNASSPVKYLTHKHILKTPTDSDEMSRLWQEVEECEDAQEIFGKQQSDGSWCAGGSWALEPSYLPKGGYSCYSPKYVTTVWVLRLLGDMGFTIQHPRVRKACDYILSHDYFLHPIFQKSQTAPDYDNAKLHPCCFAQYLIALGSVGWGGSNDYRVEIAYQILLRQQRACGGWAFEGHFQENNWTRGCPWSSSHATAALFYANNQAYHHAIIKGLKFLVWHWSIRKPNELMRFFHNGRCTVRELLMLSEYKIGLKDNSTIQLLEWLLTMYRPDEIHFKYTGKPISKHSRRKDGMDTRVAKYRLYHLIEDDWLTYYLTRIAWNLI
jgi:hypothetical protein